MEFCAFRKNSTKYERMYVVGWNLLFRKMENMYCVGDVIQFGCYPNGEAETDAIEWIVFLNDTPKMVYHSMKK